MIIKADVTPEEKIRIQNNAKAAGMSIAAYIKVRTLDSTDPIAQLPPALQYIEQLNDIAQHINKLVTTTLVNKVVYEAEIVELMNRMTAIEKVNADFLRALIKGGAEHGNTGQQIDQGEPGWRDPVCEQSGQGQAV